ncbi:MAG: hypothetical protein IKS31_01545 [Clostridia bacterium]|nr:hypothetical protein [Clostridia bacterium]
MLCPKCALEIPDDAVLCCYCGKKIIVQRRASRQPNGAGYVYQRGHTWTCRVVDHYEIPDDPEKPPKPVWKTKGGFKSKKEARLYVPTLIASTTRNHDHPPRTFKQNYDSWRAGYMERVSASTISGYSSAFKHFARLHSVPIDRISANDLQQCLDNCGQGRRIRQLMKVTAGLVFKYAIDDQQIQVNAAANLWTGNEETKHFAPLTDEELRKISDSGLPYADYIVAMCYLGHRPAEFFAFRKTDLHREKNTWYLVGGVKTDAGKDRAVTVPPKILPILQARLAVEGTDLLFPRVDRDRSGNPSGYSQMPVSYFSKSVWHPMMDALGIVGKVPYATRHTYANKIKAVRGDEKDKAGLMGHASYDITREHYQTTTLKEKKAITDKLK